MSDNRPLPDIDRLSTLAAIILLIFGLARILNLPSLQYEVGFLNISVPLSINTRGIMLALAALLTVVGADWLVQSHPQAPTGRKAVERWVLPGLTALGIGSLLTRISDGRAVWLGLLLTTLLLLAVFLAEYLTIDPADPRGELAGLGLELLAYVLIFGIAFSFRVVDLRLIFLLPTALATSGAIAWRLFRLNSPSQRSLTYGLVTGWGFAQLAIGLHYWPMPPVRGSLILLLFFYLGVAVFGSIIDEKYSRSRLAELALVAAVSIVAILVLT